MSKPPPASHEKSMGSHIGRDRKFLSFFSRLWQRKLEKVRLSPLKVLLYLDRYQKGTRASTPERLGKEIGIGGYDTIKNSYTWLSNHGYVALAPGVPTVEGVAEMIDPNELVVTPLGRDALKPFLAAFSLQEVASIALAMLGLGFVLGLTEVVFQMYPSYFWGFALLDLAFGIAVSYVTSVALREARVRKKERVASLIESVTDRG
ncbi:MAG: hypothetical protein JRN27_08475 [Nitrososphaerota archaeon]|nr:hypothetical protein [Ferrimicrobium acidiphilum]MDG6921346.1 hypothetical protein [Nitrososphaerota archaeon]MDG6949509.1 hypothetical protein [Nitrososphaerota archaeon]MDG6976109.1 hypothetical protein [Nitrososphaerota archaeon]